MQLSDALALIRPVPNFPIPGVLFQDIAPMLADADAFQIVITELAKANRKFTVVAGIESRGFILGSAVAQECKASFLPIRKAGKLPGDLLNREYKLEYGTASLEVQSDSLLNTEDKLILVIDDVLATGGTLIAALELIEDLGAEVVEVVVLLEISALAGRARILERFPNMVIRTLVKI